MTAGHSPQAINSVSDRNWSITTAIPMERWAASVKRQITPQRFVTMPQLRRQHLHQPIHHHLRQHARQHLLRPTRHHLPRPAHQRPHQRLLQRSELQCYRLSVLHAPPIHSQSGDYFAYIQHVRSPSAHDISFLSCNGCLQTQRVIIVSEGETKFSSPLRGAPCRECLAPYARERVPLSAPMGGSPSTRTTGALSSRTGGDFTTRDDN